MPHFDRFDICEAYYCLAANWHGGQFTKLYRVFGRLERIGFRSGASRPDDPDSLSENARAIYDAAEEREKARG